MCVITSYSIHYTKLYEGLEILVLRADPVDPAAAQWPVFAKVNGVDTAKVKIETIAAQVRELV